jgi:hypothetical protein
VNALISACDTVLAPTRDSTMIDVGAAHAVVVL